jgi:acyl carrier protein
MAQREQILGLLLECLQDHARQTGRTLAAAEGTPLLGPGSPLDSLGLVMVVTDFESRLNETFAAELVLASEQAMSMSQSPFRSVTALVDYAAELLGAAETP